MKLLRAVAALVLLAMSQSPLAQSVPPLNPNDWNFVLLQSLESNPKTNNLSVTGLNHSLRLGQLLAGVLTGKQQQFRQISAYRFDADDMTSLQSLQSFAVLQSQAVNVQTLNQGDASAYGSPAYVVQQILATQPRGTYVMAMPMSMLQQVVTALTGATVNLQSAHQYVVVSGQGQALSFRIYEDGIKDVSDYPAVALPKRSPCAQKPVTLRAKLPAGLQPYRSQTVYFVRHVEAHPNGTFENGNYVCQGQWRALGANARLLEKMRNQKPDVVFSSDPANIIGCTGTCSYIRPSLTVAPFAIQHELPLTLAAFQWADAADLAQALFDRGARSFKHADAGSRILVAWEHEHIVEAVQYLLGTLYQDTKAAGQIPDWSFDDYDSLWELSTDKQGNLTFRNDCEEISSAALPSTCPAFFP